MFDDMLKLLRKPALWQRSDELFWDDPHISEMMLAAHLDPNFDAASRKPEFIERSVKWLSTVIPRGAKILDLGCGPGLYTMRLSDMGYDVTGVDLSRRSIDYARGKDKKTRYIRQNYLSLDETQTYDAITLIYCDYAALTFAERRQLLSKVYGMLKPDGAFIFDVFTDAHFEKKRNQTSWYACENGGFWSAGAHICLEATHLYENGTVAADQSVVVTADAVREYIIWDTAYTTQRLADELSASRFSIKSVYGDACGSEYSERSETLCCLATKQPQ